MVWGPDSSAPTLKVCVRWLRYDEHQLRARSVTPKRQLSTRRSVMVVDSVKSGTKVKHHQSTDITVIDCFNYLVMDGNNGGLSRVMCSVGRLATPQEMLRFKVSFQPVCTAARSTTFDRKVADR